MKITVASWNIAGGHTIASHKQHDYNPEDIGYFIGKLAHINPDIICLQEAHTSPDGARAIAQEIAQALGLEFVFNSPASPSHVDAAYTLGTAIISRLPFHETKTVVYPRPNVELTWKDGRPAETHDKNLQIANMGTFSVLNTQMLPMNVFGHPYDGSDVGRELARGIDMTMEENMQNPAIFCGDFNSDNPLELYPHLRASGFIDAVTGRETMRPKNGVKRSPDHVFHTSEFQTHNADVLETNTDHFLCLATFDHAS
jgi:endonuclease/exonuclease/phosphatase family metal-dependent hydrolase